MALKHISTVLYILAASNLCAFPARARVDEGMAASLDPAGPYLILCTPSAHRDYAAALATMQSLHPGATVVELDPARLDTVLATLTKIQPRYALILIRPDELDVNFAWRWLTLTTQLDADPFPDVRTGFLTGSSPEAVARFAARIAQVAKGRAKLSSNLLDVLGPAPGLGKNGFMTSPGCFLSPALGLQLAAQSINHGSDGFDDGKLSLLNRIGLIHFGGHGYPDRIVGGLTSAQAKRLDLAPCVVFNGACYTGVVHRWFDYDYEHNRMAERTVTPADCFALNLLDRQVVAYLAALHPDHGIPVYQEMEYLASSRASLGDVIKSTYDGIVLGSGGKLPVFEPFRDGQAVPHWSPSEIMLKGTAARVLYGDPALIVTAPPVQPALEMTLKQEGNALSVRAEVANRKMLQSLTDTFHGDLAHGTDFNDRALFAVDLPEGWTSIARVEIMSVKAGSNDLPHRLVGYAVESDQGHNRLHIQVDAPNQALKGSFFRLSKAAVELRVSR